MKAINLSKLILVAFAIIAIPACTHKIQSQQSGYIKMSYYGATDKPQPIIEFYIKGSLTNPLIDTLIRDFYVESYTVSKKEFAAISKIVETTDIATTIPILEDNFAILIIKDTYKSVYFISQRGQVDLIFREMEEALKDSKKRESILESFHLVLKRLPTD